MRYRAELNPLNDSGVHGLAEAIVDTTADTMWIGVYASDLELDQIHAQHIHGRFNEDGSVKDSFTPTLADDADGDTFIEVLEGVASYGDVILPLSMPPAMDNDPATVNFEMPGLDGTYIYEQTFDLSDEGSFFSPVTGNSYSGSDLLPLDQRMLVLHGMTVDGSMGAGTDGEIDGTAGYKAVLPVAAGDFVMAVPEPSLVGFLGIGVLGLVLVSRRRRS